jgi:hypothetical protein
MATRPVRSPLTLHFEPTAICQRKSWPVPLFLTITWSAWIHMLQRKALDPTSHEAQVSSLDSRMSTTNTNKECLFWAFHNNWLPIMARFIAIKFNSSSLYSFKTSCEHPSVASWASCSAETPWHLLLHSLQYWASETYFSSQETCQRPSIITNGYQRQGRNLFRVVSWWWK